MKFIMGEEARAGDYLEIDHATGMLVRWVGGKYFAVAAEYLMSGDMVEYAVTPLVVKVDK